MAQQSASFFFNDTATTEIYTLSLHDALPISNSHTGPQLHRCTIRGRTDGSIRPRADLLQKSLASRGASTDRSEEHTSELQSLTNVVCHLLLEKNRRTRRTHRA